jgi:hypothetical protein
MQSRCLGAVKVDMNTNHELSGIKYLALYESSRNLVSQMRRCGKGLDISRCSPIYVTVQGTEIVCRMWDQLLLVILSIAVIKAFEAHTLVGPTVHWTNA